MKIGTKSLLFGVHQILWHPIIVLLAWKQLYGYPTFKELICIIVHDWGYWQKSDIDGEQGKNHPILGARIVLWLFGFENAYYVKMCLFHSRSFARLEDSQPSKLCWADKLSIAYDPWWFYMLRAKASGEWQEFHRDWIKNGFVIEQMSDRECYNKLREYFITVAFEGRY